jgi:HAD superfamily hydrolase (TIGR01450 family)
VSGATTEMLRRPERIYRGYVFDLDGTIYLGDELLPGAAETVATLRSAGARVTFLTNKPLELPADYAAKLRDLGIPAVADEVVSSTDALLRYLRLHAAGAKIYPVSEPIVADLLRDAGYTLTDQPPHIDVVVVSFDRTFDYKKLLTAFRAVQAGARIVATNPDPYCPTADGGLPDCAAMLAAIEAATGAVAEAIVGKPSPHMAATLLERLGVPAAETLLAGDRPLTDMQMARKAGMAAALVLTGATSADDVPVLAEPPDFVLERIADLLPAAGAASLLNASPNAGGPGG